MTLCIVAVLLCGVSCTERITFPDTETPSVSDVEAASAKYLWIGSDYKLAVNISVKDAELQSVQLLNGEWQIDKTYPVATAQFVVTDTFLVSKDANRTKHEVELVVRTLDGGVLRTTIDVEDLSETNQIEGYDPDILPPAINITAPTVNRFYGLVPEPIVLNVEASITEDDEITVVYAKIWGEAANGAYFEAEHTVIPSNDEEKTNLTFIHHFEIPGGIVGEYQFLVKATDRTGNQSVTGGNLIVGMIDRLYLSDAKNEDEVIGQGFDAYASADAWGLGTLVPMRKIGTNVFSLDYYYRNDDDENIRFIAFMGNDRPFNTSSPRGVRYTLDGQNVVAQTSGTEGTLTADLDATDFRLPVTQKGYYTITVDMTVRTVTAIPFTPANPDFANTALFPGYSLSAPWDYLAIISGGSVAGTSGWAEVENNTSLYREADHNYLYSGTFTTVGGANISFQAPKAVLSGNVGWFRLPAARANMKDVYGDLISEIKPVGASNNGANYGMSLTPNTKWYVTYDLITYRLRIVKTE